MASLSLEFNDQLNKYIWRAVALHLILVILAGIGHFVLKMDIFKSFIKKKDLTVVQSSVRVDVVGLPKYTLQELRKMNLGASISEIPEKVEPKQEKVNETSDIEFKKKAKSVNLSNLLSNISKKEVTKKVKKKKSKKIDTRLLNKLVLEGNKVSQGSSISGEQLDMSKQVFIAYIQELPDKIKPNWKLPTYMIERELKCRIQIFISSDGRVLKMKLFESSGDEEYDQKAIEAIKLSSPLPKPPTSILSDVANGNVILGFPL